MHVHHVPHAERMESCRSDEAVKMMSCCNGCAVLHLLSFISLLSEVNRSYADAQVVFCHFYPVIPLLGS